MDWKRQDANERGDEEWVPDGANVMDITIFHNGEHFVVVMGEDEYGTADTLDEAKKIAESLVI